MDQRENAIACMKEWLSHENELGKQPAKIEIAQEFDLHALHYYIIKFKKDLFSKWMVGVCGGYEKDGLGHCGHIFSQYENYNSETAQEKCIEMVEMIREYWIEEAKKHEEPEARTTFVDFVLLEDSNIDLIKAFDYLKDHWQLNFEEVEKNDEQIYVTQIGETIISLSLMNAPIPEGEAEYYAQGCYMWEDAVNEVKKHNAYIIVSTLGKEMSVIEAKILQSQLIDACLQFEQAIGMYGSQIVWPKHIYTDVMNDYLNDHYLPIVLWVYLGIVTNQEGNHIYTIGLRDFGHYELETVPSALPLNELHEFIFNVVCYIIEEGAILHNGETIGMSATQKCEITLSQGVFLDEMTLKIAVQNENN